MTTFPGDASGKELACQCRRCKRHRFNLWVGKILWRRAWQPPGVFWLGELHGQRSLVGYSSWDHKESDMTEATEHIDYQLCLPNVHLCTVLGTEDIKVQETCEVPNPGTFAFSILALITYKLTITVAFHVSLSHNSLCLTHSGPMVNIWLVFSS